MSGNKHVWMALGLVLAVLRMEPASATMIAAGDFSYRCSMTFPGYNGSGALTNFPVLVRLAEGQPSGFSPAACAADGSDLRFTDEQGEVLAHEVETWNAAGESLVWVRVPVLTAATSLTFYYGSANPGEQPAATNVWAGYVGVWHLDDTGSVAADATSNGLDAAYTKVAAVNVATGAVGACCTVSAAAGTDKSGGGILVDKSHAALLNVGSALTLSIWIRHNSSTPVYDRLVSRKTDYNQTTGWETEFGNGNWNFLFRGGGDSSVSDISLGACQSQWMLVTLVADGTTGCVYTNGVLAKSGTITAITDRTDTGLAFGNNASLVESMFRGDLDEIRFVGAARSAGWTKAEYDTVASGSFVSLGAVEVLRADVPAVTAYAVRDIAQTSAVITGALMVVGSPAPTVSVLLGVSPDAFTVTNSLGLRTGMGALSFSMTGLQADTTYYAAFLAGNGNTNVLSRSLSFHTLGAPVFGEVAASNHDSTVFARAALADIGLGNVTLACWAGASPDALTETTNWTGVTTTDAHEALITGWPLGTRCYYAFSAQCAIDGRETSKIWSTTNSILVAQDAWLYATNMIMDGLWTLPVTVDGTEITVTGHLIGSGGLNLAKPVVDTNGTAYTIVAVRSDSFHGDTDLTDVRFPQTLRTLGDTSFYATSLTNIDLSLPALTNISQQVFMECPNLLAVRLAAPALVDIGSRAFRSSPLSQVDVSGWDLSGVQSIGEEAFRNCAFTGRLSLPAIQTIGELAFGNAGAFGAIDLTSPNLTNIAFAVFYQCPALTNVLIRAPGLTVFSKQLFDGTPLTDTDLGTWDTSNIVLVCERAFCGCKCYGKISLPAVQSLETYSLGQMPNLQEIELASPDLTNLAFAAFYQCFAVTNVLLQAPRLEVIGAYAFNGPDFSGVDLSKWVVTNVVEIGQQAFKGGKLGDVTNFRLSKVRIIHPYAFESAGMTGCLDLPAVTNIEEHGVIWVGISEIRLGAKGLAGLGPAVLYGCPNLERIVIGATGDVVCANQTFDGGDSLLTNIVFYGPAPAQSNLDRFVTSAAASVDGTHKVTIYASKRQAGWSAYRDNFIDSEANRPDSCLGVYRADSRKAWIVDRRSDYDRMGFSIHIVDNLGHEIPYDWLAACPAEPRDKVSPRTF